VNLSSPGRSGLEDANNASCNVGTPSTKWPAFFSFKNVNIIDMTAAQMYWYKLQQQRAAAYARLMKAHAALRKFVPYVAAGGNPSDRPDYDEYCWLINEFGDQFFLDELEKFRLTKEECNEGN
jgi:hypothetical protein